VLDPAGLGKDLAVLFLIQAHDASLAVEDDEAVAVVPKSKAPM